MTQSAVTKVLEPVIRKLALSSHQLGPQLDEATIQDALDVAGYSSTFIGQDRAKAALGFAIGTRRCHRQLHRSPLSRFCHRLSRGALV